MENSKRSDKAKSLFGRKKTVEPKVVKPRVEPKVVKEPIIEKVLGYVKLFDEVNFDDSLYKVRGCYKDKELINFKSIPNNEEIGLLIQGKNIKESAIEHATSKGKETLTQD